MSGSPVARQKVKVKLTCIVRCIISCNVPQQSIFYANTVHRIPTTTDITVVCKYVTENKYSPRKQMCREKKGRTHLKSFISELL